MNTPLIATLGFDYELHRMYGRHLKQAGFSVMHFDDTASMKRMVPPKSVDGIVVSLDAIGHSQLEIMRIVRTWPQAAIITSGQWRSPEIAHKFLSVGVGGHLDWGSQQPREVVQVVSTLCGIL